MRSSAARSKAACTQALGLGVERRGGLVENEHARIGGDSPGSRDALRLPAGEPQTTFADLGRVALRHGRNEIVRVGNGGRLDDPRFRNIVAAKPDVVGHRAREEHGVLEHDAHVAPQLGRGDRGHVMSIHEDASVVRLQKAQQQVRDGGLAGAAGTDQGRGPTGGRREAHVLDHGRAALVGGVDVLEVDLATDVRQATRGVRFPPTLWGVSRNANSRPAAPRACWVSA